MTKTQALLRSLHQLTNQRRALKATEHRLDTEQRKVMDKLTASSAKWVFGSFRLVGWRGKCRVLGVEVAVALGRTSNPEVRSAVRV